MSQQDYENLPTVPYMDKHGRAIPIHPELLAEVRAQLPVLYPCRKNQSKNRLKTRAMTTYHGIHKCSGNQRQQLSKMKGLTPSLV